jgi:hypothetical protein
MGGQRKLRSYIENCRGGISHGLADKADDARQFSLRRPPIVLCSRYDLLGSGGWRQHIRSLGFSATARLGKGKVRDKVSRSETLKLVETYLSRARDMMQGPEDDVLSYLIDVALSETQDRIDSEKSNRRTEQHSVAKLGGGRRGHSGVLHLLVGDKLG